jgi:transcriptional regulator with XRE-family HTH domain
MVDRDEAQATALLRGSIRSWIKSILTQTGWSAHELARRSGLAGKTVTRFLDENYQNFLSVPTMRAIAETSGVPVPSDVFAGPPDQLPLASYDIMLLALGETDYRVPDGTLDERARTLVETYNFILVAVHEGIAADAAARLARRQYDEAVREVRQRR